MLPTLIPHCHVLAPDIPGFGGTPFDPTFRKLDDAAFWLRDLTEELGWTRFVLAGHSMGGYIAMAFAEHFPDRLLGLGLLHSTALPDTEERKANRTKAAAFIETQGAPAFLKTFVPSLFYDPRPAWLEALQAITAGTDPQAMAAFTRMMRDRPDRTHVAAGLTVPLMYIVGEHDTLVTPARSEEELRKVKVALTHRIPEAGHMGMYEAPEKVGAALLSLAKLSHWPH